MNISREFTKHPLAPVITAAVSAAFVVSLYVEPVLSGSSETLATRQALVSITNAPNYVLSGLAAVGSFVMIFVGAAVMGAEFRWGTARHQAVLNTTGRWLTTKLAFASLLPVIAVVTGLVTGIVASQLASSALGAPPAPVTFSWMATVIQVVTTLAGLELWLVVSMGATLLLRGATRGAVATLAYVYLESMFAPILLPGIAPYLPATAQIATLQAFRYLPDVGLIGAPTILPGVAWSAAMIVVVAAMTLVVGAVIVLGSHREQPL